MNGPPNEISFSRYCAVSVLLICLFVGATWVWLIVAPMYYFSGEYGVWQAKLQFIREGKMGTLAIVGDSRPNAGLLPLQIGPGVVNLAIPGISAIDIYYLSQKIVSQANCPKAILLSVSPALFCDPQYYWARSVGFGFLTLDQIDEVRRSCRALHDTQLYGASSPGDIDARLTDFLYHYRFPPYFFWTLVNGRIYQRHELNRVMMHAVLSTRGQTYFGMGKDAAAPDFETLLKAFVPSKVVDDYFGRTLALYQSRHIPVYFISSPHSAYSGRLYPPGLAQDFGDYLKSYEARYANFHVLGDPLPEYPNDEFGDAYHLNEKGAPLWSAAVVKLLNEAHVEGGPFGPH
jgi:hypothetical protein